MVFIIILKKNRILYKVLFIEEKLFVYDFVKIVLIWGFFFVSDIELFWKLRIVFYRVICIFIWGNGNF